VNEVRVSKPAFLASLVAGVLLSTLPFVWYRAPLGPVLIRPGTLFLHLFTTTDVLGIPEITLYVLGGVLFWSFVVLALLVAARLLRNALRAAT